MDDDKKKTEEELEKLLKAIEKLEEDSKNQNKKKRKRRSFIAIEFGGVFHHNRFINFIFSFILNLAIAYTVIEVFSFATYDDFLYIVLFILAYSILEYILRLYLYLKHFKWIIKSFGTLFYFVYILIFYFLDYYVFVNVIEFDQAVLLMAFITLFTVIRYFISMFLRRRLRWLYGNHSWRISYWS